MKKRQVAVIEDIDQGSIDEKSIAVYNLPDGIKDVNEIWESEDFKKFREEKLARLNKIKTGNSLDKILKGGIPRGNMSVFVGKSQGVECGLIDYLKHINQKGPKVLKIKDWLSKNKI